MYLVHFELSVWVEHGGRPVEEGEEGKKDGSMEDLVAQRL